MLKPALVIATGLFGFSLCATAQETVVAPAAVTLYRPDVFRSVDSSALLHQLPLFALLDGRRLPVSTDIGRMGIAPLNLFPAAFLVPMPAQRTSAVRTAITTDPKNPFPELFDSPLHPTYATGEVGVLYGRWSGKYGGDLWQTYMMGEVGNDTFHITAGAEYEESSRQLPRFRAFGPVR